jgi:hypothetical protein
VIRSASFHARAGLATIALAVSACLAGVATSAAAANPCTATGTTAAVAAKIFGHGASVSYNHLTNQCDVKTTTTVVSITSKSYFHAQVTNWLESLNDGGRASQIGVTGAGSGAVLLVATKYQSGYGPLLEFAAGPYSVIIQSYLGGEGRTRSEYKQWEALARAIYAHLG